MRVFKVRELHAKYVQGEKSQAVRPASDSKKEVQEEWRLLSALSDHDQIVVSGSSLQDGKVKMGSQGFIPKGGLSSYQLRSGELLIEKYANGKWYVVDSQNRSIKSEIFLETL